MRIAVFGDIGGHAQPFADELIILGCDPETGEMPDDLVVVQVGDLIHRGPDQEAVLVMVARFMAKHPDRWIQLVGNHESHYLGGPEFIHGGPELQDNSIVELQTWWATHKIFLACGIHGDDGRDWLVTHAGLTYLIWRHLNSPKTVGEAADRINELGWSNPDAAFWPGWMLGGNQPDYKAGVVWAHPTYELYDSWGRKDATASFGQIHGHATSYNWSRGTLDQSVDVAKKWGIIDRADVDLAMRHTTIWVHGIPFIEVDVGMGRYGNVRPQPYIIEGELVAPAVAPPVS